jgi:hypothetical protein
MKGAAEGGAAAAAAAAAAAEGRHSRVLLNTHCYNDGCDEWSHIVADPIYVPLGGSFFWVDIK